MEVAMSNLSNRNKILFCSRTSIFDLPVANKFASSLLLKVLITNLTVSYSLSFVNTWHTNRLALPEDSLLNFGNK